MTTDAKTYSIPELSAALVRVMDAASTEAGQLRQPSLLDYAPGLHRDVPNAVYHARILGMASKGALDVFGQSPLHYRAWIDGLVEDEETPALLFGSAFHCAILEPDRFAREYATEPEFGDCRTKANKKRRDAWRKEHEGATLISTKDARAIQGMVAAVRGHRLAGKMIRDGEAELTALWKDEETGLRCRARGDYHVAKHAMLVDVKSAIDASPEGFRRAVFQHGYHHQDAHYRSGFEALGAEVQHFVFVCVEKTPPYAVGLYRLDAAAMSIGYEKVRDRMRRLAECVAKNEWPGYGDEIQTLLTPAWAS